MPRCSLYNNLPTVLEGNYRVCGDIFDRDEDIMMLSDGVVGMSIALDVKSSGVDDVESN
jgi:hypothetical protein